MYLNIFTVHSLFLVNFIVCYRLFPFVLHPYSSLPYFQVKIGFTHKQLVVDTLLFVSGNKYEDNYDKVNEK